MTLTRWKLMAGVLGLTMCGLAALAEPACRTVGYTARQQPTTPLPAVDTGSKPVPPPVVVPPPKPDPLPSPFPAGTEVPAPLPLPGSTAKIPVPDLSPPKKEDTAAPPPLPNSSLPPLPVDKAAVPAPTLPLPNPPPVNPFAEGPKPLAPIGEPKVVPGGMDEKAFTEVAKSQLKLPDLPKLGDPAPPKTDTPPLPLSRPPEVTFREPSPVSPTGDFTKPDVPKRTLDLPLPPTSATLPPPVVTPELPQPKPATGFKLDTGAVIPAPVPTPKTVEKVETLPVSGTASAERKLKVLLCLGAGKPWFEVRDGEELVLKVVSDAVEVKAPATSGEAADVLKASGRVSFRTLGGNGTCDELRVNPGTGEVVVSGKVAVTSNWGKAETTATADKMTFRLNGETVGMRK